MGTLPPRCPPPSPSAPGPGPLPPQDALSAQQPSMPGAHPNPSRLQTPLDGPQGARQARWGRRDSRQGAERSACLSSGRVAFRGWGGEERTVQVVGPGPRGLDDARRLRLLHEGGWWGAGRTVSARPRRPLSGSCRPSVLPLPLSFWVIRESSLIGASQAHAPQQARHSKRPPRSREVFSAQKPWPTRPAARRPCQPPLPQDRSPAPRTAPRPRPRSHAARPLAHGDHVPAAGSAAATAALSALRGGGRSCLGTLALAASSA